jgi:hypothetical protein
MNPLETVEELIHEIDTAADPNIRSAARKLVQALMDFHCTAVARMIQLCDAATVGAFGRDETAGALLLLYDLHPDSTETRVRRAIDPMRNVHLVSVDHLAVTVNVTGRGHANPTREAIEIAVLSAAPEVQTIRIEGLNSPDFVPLKKLMAV